MFIKYSISEILRFLIFCNICRIVEKPGWRFRIEWDRLLQWRGEKVYLDADGTTYFPTNLSLTEWLSKQLGEKTLTCTYILKCFSNLWHLKSNCSQIAFKNRSSITSAWFPKLYKNSLSEIFLIWTNVARTNVAWTNVTLTAGICSKCSQEPTFKVSSKSGQ